MAIKDSKKNVTQRPQKGDVVNSAPKAEENVNNNLKEKNLELEKQLDEMMKSYKDMQLQMQNLLIASQAQNSNNNIEGRAAVGCRIFNGVNLSSQGGDISIPIQYREETEISYGELREIFKNPFGFKNMFKKGTLYFVNKDDYKNFNIKPEIDLSDEYFLDMLKNNSNTVIEEAKKGTNDKKDLAQVFAFIYQIAYLIDSKRVELDYEVRSSLEKYFDVDFKTLINNLHQ